jgi:hypothetical protein
MLSKNDWLQRSWKYPPAGDSPVSGWQIGYNLTIAIAYV